MPSSTPGLWQGIVPPQYVFAHRRFLGIALEPPNFEPGSWIGAGKALYDHQSGRFLLTARPRKATGGVRGYEANIYASPDGEHFEQIASLSKAEVIAKSGVQVHSIEGTQLLKDPLTGRWHFYLSCDTGADFVWGGLHWETLLMTAADLTGPWESAGLVLRTDQDYDALQARDSTIDIVDGRWLCLYKAINAQRQERPALATSSDGRILITGGRAMPGTPPLSSAYIARPRSAGRLGRRRRDRSPGDRARQRHQALVLCDGTILVSGGTPDQFPAERYNPPPLDRR